MHTACPDRYQCALPDPATGQTLNALFFQPVSLPWTGALGIDQTETVRDETVLGTGKYGRYCEPFDASEWSPALQPLAKLVQDNDPSGIPAVNFMGGIVRLSCLALRDRCGSDSMYGGLHSTRDSNDPWVGVLPMQRPGY
jgi:hypothetical protein